MKIKQIMLKNFANVNQIEINLSDSVTYLIGENGSGKTTVGLNAVWFILEGLALKGQKVLHGDRFRFIGKQGKSAIGKLVLHDEAKNIDIIIQRKLLNSKRLSLQTSLMIFSISFQSILWDLQNLTPVNRLRRLELIPLKMTG